MIWLCDLDGTLVDSTPVHDAAFRAALAETAPELLGSFRYERHAGASTDEVAAVLGLGTDDARRLAGAKRRHYRAYVDAGRVKVFPGARRFLAALAAGGQPAYLITSGSRGSVERVLAACSLGGWFRGVLTGDDVPVSKPDPAFYLRACERWGIGPDEAVAVEDSAHGVASAVGAGLTTFQVNAAEPAPGAVHLGGLDDLAGLAETGARP
ncbi:HAD family phosphatase [Actinomadura madurae]|uniref:HAD family hydrolase n=1 Tax=Actinomadura madurae TaxID=1993 RepID=UPI002027347A|nr:HAD family phosphatase [Actinomadura madurae]URM98135.1 HAD family phosphatase [Actinomadura madurae]